MTAFFRSHILYLASLVAAGWKTHLLGFNRTVFLGMMMFVQNLIFFCLWFVFFHAVGDIKGWKLEQISIMFGNIALAIGLTLFFMDGVRSIFTHVQNGTIDGFLMRPRHPLLPLLLSRSNAASLGDIFSAPFYWFYVAGVPLDQGPYLLLLSLMAAVIFTSCLVIFFSLGFWLKAGGRFSDQLFEMLIIFSNIPQHGHPMLVQIIMFSVLPAGFISFIPVELGFHFDAGYFCVLLAATLIYAVAAVCVFNAGVKRYIAS